MNKKKEQDILEKLTAAFSEAVREKEEEICKRKEEGSLEQFVNVMRTWSETVSRTAKMLELDKQARQYSSAGKYQSAARTYIELAELDPKRRDSYLQKAQKILGYSN